MKYQGIIQIHGSSALNRGTLYPASTNPDPRELSRRNQVLIRVSTPRDFPQDNLAWEFIQDISPADRRNRPLAGRSYVRQCRIQ
jgi:hypothetical protein